MSGRYLLSPRAQTDLDEIWDYTASRWGFDQAESYTRDLWNRIERIAKTPELGQECSNVRAALQNRLWLARTLLPTYIQRRRRSANLHERMDFERHIP
jgi:toxin ParE1/3/4